MSDASENIAWWRIAVIGVLMLLLCSLLIFRLWDIQILDAADYSGAQSKQSFRRVQHPGSRGRIFDRNGVVLAENLPNRCIVLYVEEHRSKGAWSNTVAAVDLYVDKLSSELKLPRKVTKKQIKQHVEQKLPMPFILWEHVSYETAAFVAEHRGELRGVDLMTLPERSYPLKNSAAHILGFVRPEQPDKPDSEKWHFYLPEMHGKAGIELQYDSILSGRTGEEVLRVDSRGYARDRWVKQAAVSGADLHLTIDSKLQQLLEHDLSGRSGAAVILDPRNGDVLALVSMPNYDANKLQPPVSPEFWNSLMIDSQKPLFNRAIQGAYPPGSVFKPFTMLSALENGIDAEALYNCTGIYDVYGLRLRCAHRWGHGKALNMEDSLAVSCNPYFCQIAAQLGIENLSVTARQAGFGVETGIDLGGEVSGLMPTAEWKKQARKSSWTATDTSTVGIGQGFLLATPLQIASAFATLATGGIVMRPRLVEKNMPEGDCVRRISWSHDSVAKVINGMRKVVTEGSGRKMQVDGVDVAAKTGTAEYQVGRERRKHTWSVAFAPASNPEIVIVVLVENGVSGGATAGPIIQNALSVYFNAKTLQVDVSEEGLQD